jgi:hypothetical protein
VAYAGLVVYMPQFAACVLQEKLALNPIDRHEEISEEDSEPREKHGPVQMKNKPLVWHQKLELTHEIKRKGEQYSKDDEHGICDHNLTTSFMQKFATFVCLF